MSDDGELGGRHVLHILRRPEFPPWYVEQCDLMRNDARRYDVQAIHFTIASTKALKFCCKSTHCNKILSYEEASTGQGPQVVDALIL